MPLIMISGYPSAGKTHRAEQLWRDLSSRIERSTNPAHSRLRVVLINDQSLGISRDAYREARTEKEARGLLSSAIKRELSRDVIVIADALNYIKGFRYQMYCEAKAVKTMSCVVSPRNCLLHGSKPKAATTALMAGPDLLTLLEVHVGTPIEKCRSVNVNLVSNTPTEKGYAGDLFENLIFRYEEPNGMNRWDSPLFTVPYDDADPPYDAIWEALIGNEGSVKVARPNQATIAAPQTASDYLYDLDKMTQEVIILIQTWQADHTGEAGGTISVPGVKLALELPTSSLSLPQLQRLRRQFTQLSRQTRLSTERIKEMFVGFLNNSWS